MPAALKARDTKEVEGRTRGLPMAANAKIFGGTMVALNATGQLTKGATSASLRCLGVAMRTYDNSTGVAGAVTAEVVRGVYGPFANSASTDQITAADIETQCFMVDDQTVAKTNGGGTRSVAGVVYQVDGAGVWVRF